MFLRTTALRLLRDDYYLVDRYFYSLYSLDFISFINYKKKPIRIFIMSYFYQAWIRLVLGPELWICKRLYKVEIINKYFSSFSNSIITATLSLFLLFVRTLPIFELNDILKITSEYTYNLGHNILELCNALVQIRLTTSKTQHDIWCSKVGIRVASRVAKWLKT